MDDEKRKAAYDYINSYQKEKYDRIVVLRKSGDKKKLTAIAAGKNLSVSAFINACIDEKLSRMKIKLEDVKTDIPDK